MTLAKILTTAQGLFPAQASDARFIPALSEAIAVHDASKWNKALYAYGMIYYALHILEQEDAVAAGAGSATGPLQARRTGQVSESFLAVQASPSGDPADFNFTETVFGRRYLAIRQRNASSAASVIAFGGYR